MPKVMLKKVPATSSHESARSVSLCSIGSGCAQRCAPASTDAHELQTFADLWEVSVIQAHSDDTCITQSPSKQRSPSFVANGPGTPRDKDDGGDCITLADTLGYVQVQLLAGLQAAAISARQKVLIKLGNSLHTWCIEVPQSSCHWWD